MVEEKLLLTDIHNFLLDLQKKKNNFKFKIIKNEKEINIWIKQNKDNNVIENCYSISTLVKIADLIGLKDDIINEILFN